MKIVSGHQPAFIPWLGLIHKLMVSDVFVFMDIAKFRKRAFMHRNVIEINDKKNLIGLKVNDKSDYLLCDNVKISDFHKNNLDEIKSKLINIYKNSNFFNDLQEFISETFKNDIFDLNTICLSQLKFLKKKFNLKTEIILESEIINKDNNMSATARLVEHATKTQAKIYVTGINSINYLDKNLFKEKKIHNYVQKFDYTPFKVYQSTNEPLSIVHQISKIGFNKINQIMLETQKNKKEIIKLYD